LPSIGREPAGPDATDWRAAGMRYYSRNFFCRKKFGQRVWKVSLDGHFSCPNRDGTLDTRGCIFCNPESFSPSRRTGLASITAQLQEGIRRLRSRHRVERFVAYFQPATNTYLGQTCTSPTSSGGCLPIPADLSRLRSVFEEALAHPSVIGLAIGTRPDCVSDPILDLLSELSSRTWLTVEYGLQTMHNRSLDWLNRGHHYDAFLDALQRSRRRGLEIGVHVILGLPGESREDMLATAKELARMQVDSVKLHNLYAVRGTRLADLVVGRKVRLPELGEYAGYVVDFLEVLPADCVIDRLSGDAPPEYLVAPSWCLDKAAIRAAIEAEFERRGTWQGARAVP
jgi:uncharacterized protein